MRRIWALGLITTLSLITSACAIPRQGALDSELRRGAPDGSVVVRPIAETDALKDRRSPIEQLPDRIVNMQPSQSDRLFAGDELGLTIIEGMSPTVPSAIGGRLDLPKVDVDRDGSIAIPFAGRLHVAGQSLSEAQRLIEANLRRSLYMPQVQLRRLTSLNQSVSIVGEVTTGGSYPIAANMLRLTDLVGAAGVKAEKAQQVQVEIRRGGESFQIGLRSLLNDGRNNIALMPGDVVSITRKPEFVTVIGAIMTSGRVEIIGDDYSILDALADARGLNERNADPSGIYLFPDGRKRPDGLPVTVIAIDIRDPAQVLLARNLRMADGDLVYVSTASFAQTMKVLDIISRTLTPFSRLPSDL